MIQQGEKGEPLSEEEFSKLIWDGGVFKAREIESKIWDMDLDKNRLLTYEELM